MSPKGIEAWPPYIVSYSIVSYHIEPLPPKTPATHVGQVRASDERAATLRAAPRLSCGLDERGGAHRCVVKFQKTGLPFLLLRSTHLRRRGFPSCSYDLLILEHGASLPTTFSLLRQHCSTAACLLLEELLRFGTNWTARRPSLHLPCYCFTSSTQLLLH